MRKRAGLARALALDPEILFLDEPTAGLDPIGAAAFDRLIGGLQRSLGLTVVMVTHDLDSLRGDLRSGGGVGGQARRGGYAAGVAQPGSPVAAGLFRRAARPRGARGRRHAGSLDGDPRQLRDRRRRGPGAARRPRRVQPVAGRGRGRSQPRPLRDRLRRLGERAAGGRAGAVPRHPGRPRRRHPDRSGPTSRTCW